MGAGRRPNGEPALLCYGVPVENAALAVGNPGFEQRSSLKGGGDCDILVNINHLELTLRAQRRASIAVNRIRVLL